METLLESWRINCRLNHYLLAAIPAEQLAAKLAKGKTVGGSFTHAHNVRLMWLKEVAPDLWAGQAKFESDTANHEEISTRLAASDLAMEEIFVRAGAPDGRIKGFKPHVQAFLGYLISHETFHRASAEIALRQNGTPITDKVAYGLWEWGVR